MAPNSIVKESLLRIYACPNISSPSIQWQGVEQFSKADQTWFQRSAVTPKVYEHGEGYGHS